MEPTNTKPKRPLSAYNLFYRFKRCKLLEAHENGDESKQTVNRLISALPGLEDYPSTRFAPIDHMKELRRNEIRFALLDNLGPNDSSKRAHRKSHGAMSFLEMNKAMCVSWKSIDDFARGVFEELADDGREAYHKRVTEYEESYPNSPKLAKDVVRGTGHRAGFVVQTTGDVPALKRAKKCAADDGEPRPKRPLSSYNLFYRFKRFKILEAYEKGDFSPETSDRLIRAASGLEDDLYIPSTLSFDERVKNLRREKIRSLLVDNLGPKNSSNRSHRKTHGAISFLEMNRIMCDSWKSIDDFARGVFDELSNEGRNVHLKKVAEYEAKHCPSPQPKRKIRVSNSEALIAMPMTTPKSKKHEDVKVASHIVNIMLDAPAAGGVLAVAPPPVSPTSFDFLDVGSVSFPFFPDIFDEDEELRSDDSHTDLLSAVTQSSEEHDLNDFPPLPFSHVYENEHQREIKASADDFLKLIATLDGN